MDIRRVIDARDGLQARLDEVYAELARLQNSCGNRRHRMARIDRLGRDAERLEKGIFRLNCLAADLAERKPA